MQRAYDEIKRQIISLEIAPGARLDEGELTRELALSRTPVREAMFQLAAEGMVEVVPKAGFVVRPIDLLDIRQLFEAQILVVKLVSRLAAQRVSAAEIEDLREAKEAVERAYATRDYMQMTSTNAAFHRLEARAAHNRYIQGMADSINDQAQRLSYLSYTGWGSEEDSALDAHLAKVIEDHDRLLGALEAHDAEAASEIGVEHVLDFHTRVARFIESDAVTAFGISDEDLAHVPFANVTRPTPILDDRLA
jgi:DNA-binding GntR family transcriptional regulator